MSSRQIRRLQQLVLASTEAEQGAASVHDDGAESDDDDDDAWSSSRVAVTTLTARARKRHGKRSAHGGAHDVAKDSSATPHTDGDDARSIRAAQQQQQQQVRATHDDGRRDEAPRRAPRNAAAKQRRRAKDAEDEALLEAVLAQQEQQKPQQQQQQQEQPSTQTHVHGDMAATRHAQHTPDTRAHGDSTNDGDDDADAAVLDADMLSLLLACDAACLNTRLERIRAFGAAAVEDVGDGLVPPRRPDGGKRDNGSTSIFPEHHMRLSFRASALATPNRYRWPPYDDHDMVLERVPSTSTTTTTRTHGGNNNSTRNADTYVLRGDSQACRVADLLLQQCMHYSHSLEALLHCLSACNVYHVPVLVACYEALCAVGETHKACEMVDCALYHIGVQLSHFPRSATWRQRQLPLRRGCNRHVFDALRLGVCVAHQRGCVRTAHEMARLLLSLDALDPCRVLRLLDYTALRARRWWWLVQLHHALVRATSDSGSSSDDNNNDDNDDDDDNSSGREACLARRVLQLPGYSFAAALAMHSLACEAARARGSVAATTTTTTRSLVTAAATMSSNSSNNKSAAAAYKPSRVWRELTPPQRAWLQREVTATTTTTMSTMSTTTPSRAARMLADAMLAFPLAASLLVDALGGATTLCERSARNEQHRHDAPAATRASASSSSSSSCALDAEAWAHVLDAAARMRAHESLYAVQVHVALAQRFVALHGDLWKSADAQSLLSSVLCTRVHRRVDGDDDRTSAVAATAMTSVLAVQLRKRGTRALFSLDAARRASVGDDAVAASDVEWLWLYARADGAGGGSGGSSNHDETTAITPVMLTHAPATLAAAAAVAGGDDDDNDEAQWANVGDDGDDAYDDLPEHVLRALDID